MSQAKAVKSQPSEAIIVLLGLFALLGGCDYAPRSDLAAIRQELTEVKTKLSELEVHLRDLQGKVGSANARGDH
jgi:hypothetical protein